MSSLRRSLLRRYRLRSPQLLRNGLLLLALLLLWDGIAAFRTPQIQAALTLNATSNRQTASSPFVASPRPREFTPSCPCRAVRSP